MDFVEIVRHFFAEIDSTKRVPVKIDVSFYPYTGLNNTIRLRQGTLFIRLSDLLEEAPPYVQKAIIGILIAKLLKKSSPKGCEQIFNDYARLPSTKNATQDVRRERGFKYISSVQGKYYNLLKLFNELNEKYFNNELELPTLTWSRGITRRVLGHYDSTHKTLVISQSLDTEKVPYFFISYVLYHEMLHMKHESRQMGTRVFVHTPEFNSEEKQFPYYDAAILWMKKFGNLNLVKRKKTIAK